MSQELQQLAMCDKPWAAQRAQYALQLTEAYQTNQISADEYRALLEDLVRSDVLNSEADDINVKNMLVYAVYGLSKLA